jgi:hypothetical protein
MRVETERKVYESKAWTHEIEHIFGPCLACSLEIEYETHGYTWGKKWIMEQFEPETRLSLVRSLEAGRVYGAPNFNALKKTVLCESCIAKFGNILEERLAELELKRKLKEERKEQERREQQRQYEWQYEWRKPKAGEFERTLGTEIFYAILGKAEYEIVFRWRISNRCKCRGSSAGAVVGMWVDETLVAHYYGWDLTSDEKNPYGSSEFQDRFGTGFERWFERKFQKRLLRAKPDAAWRVRDRELMAPDESEAWLVHVTWLNGEKYAKVGPLPSITEVAEFAATKLRMTVLGSDRRSVLPSEESAAVGC